MTEKSPAAERTARHRGRVLPLGPRTETTLVELRDAARTCRACPLWRNATQTVFGEGPADARVVLVGEQPGDQEDLSGRPFIGPAGRLLDRALAQAGLDRRASYVTNAVKHFKFEPRGKRRLHKKPVEVEIGACEQWLERELTLLTPALIVALGATAARAIFGRARAIEKNRGRVFEPQHDKAGSAAILVTIHPSFLLRMRDEDRNAGFDRFVADLALAKPYATK
jgi:uracil-DNA glycosylase family protein